MVKPRQIFGGFGNSLFQYAYLYSQFRKGAIPDIYVQDESYFKEYKDEIRALYGQGLTPTDMVSIHVRRGDYINNPFYVDLTQTDYYKNAMKEFPGAKFLVFCADRQEGSDDEADMEWCRDNFQGRDFEFFRGETELDDFNAMASCKAHIIANSSFSWWAAYVSGNRTIAPEKWFGDDIKRISIPDTWKLL
jgi:hypothetical protein